MRGMYNKLPQYVYLKSEKFIINTDYRIFIEFEERMQEEGNKQVIAHQAPACHQHQAEIHHGYRQKVHRVGETEPLAQISEFIEQPFTSGTTIIRGNTIINIVIHVGIIIHVDKRRSLRPQAHKANDYRRQ